MKAIWHSILTLLLMLVTPACCVGRLQGLQEMVDAQPSGATLTVPDGTYNGPLAIERPLTLVASGQVVIQGPGKGDVVKITAPDVTLRRIPHSRNR